MSPTEQSRISSNMDEEVTIEQTTVETVEKPKIEVKVKEPKNRDHEAILELRKENERLRKTMDEQSTARAEELSNKKLEDLRVATEASAQQNAEKIVAQRLKEIEEATKVRLVKAELKAHALKANVVDWEDLYLVLQKDLKSIEFDQDGEVSNAGDLITSVKNKKPHLFAGVNTTSTERSPVTREAAKNEKPALKMSKDEYERAKLRLARM